MNFAGNTNMRERLEDDALSQKHQPPSKNKRVSEKHRSVPRHNNNELVKPQVSLVKRVSLRLRKLKLLDKPKSVRERYPDGGKRTANKIGMTNHANGTSEIMPRLKAQLMDANPEVHLSSTSELRKLLSIATNPPIQEVIEFGLVPRLVEFLSHPNELLQFEALWCLTNVASGTSEQTRACIDAGVLDGTFDLVTSMNEDLRVQAVWLIGNVAGDSVAMRDLLLEKDAMTLVLANCNPRVSTEMLQNTAWCMSNFCRGKPSPAFELIAPCLPKLSPVLQIDDVEVLADICWLISYFSDGDDRRIQAIIDQKGLTQRLIELLKHPQESIQRPALRSLGNLLTGSDHLTDFVVGLGIIPALLQYLQPSASTNFRKEAMWSISNIAAGTQPQIQQLLDCPEIMSEVVRISLNDILIVVQESIWVLSNLTAGGTVEQITHIVQRYDIVTSLLRALRLEGLREQVQVVACEGLANIAKKCKDIPGIREKFQECNSGELLESVDLREGSEMEVHIKAVLAFVEGE